MDKKKLLLFLLGTLLGTLFFVFDLGRFLTLESLKGNRDFLLAWHAEHRLATVALFMLTYIVQTGLSLPGATILSLAAGALFGPWRGTLYVVTAATLGAGIAFLAGRYLFRDWVVKKFGGKLEGINRELETRGLNYLLFLRLIPLFPFFLINLAGGLTRLPLRTFLLGTFVGIIPGSFVYVNAGAGLAAIDTLADIASPRVLGAFALLGLFALIPVIHGKIKGRGTSADLK